MRQTKAQSERREQRKRGGRRRDAHEIEKEQHGLQLKQNKDLVTLCGTVELHGRRLKSTTVNHHWFWKMSLRLKPFIWPFPVHLLCLRLSCLLLSLRLLGHCVKCWFSHIWSNTFQKFVNVPRLSSRTGIPRSSLAVKSNQCKLCALEA